MIKVCFRPKLETIFENIMNNIQVKCANTFQEVLAEIFDMMAPKICSHFSLVQQTAETNQISPANFKFLQVWKKLRPLYESLYDNKKQIEKCTSCFSSPSSSSGSSFTDATDFPAWLATPSSISLGLAEVCFLDLIPYLSEY